MKRQLVGWQKVWPWFDTALIAICTVYPNTKVNTVNPFLDNISEDTQEMPQLQSTSLPGHQKKERWGINKEKTNATHETIDAQTNKNTSRKHAYIILTPLNPTFI